jgi:hypothetical protein
VVLLDQGAAADHPRPADGTGVRFRACAVLNEAGGGLTAPLLDRTGNQASTPMPRIGTTDKHLEVTSVARLTVLNGMFALFGLLVISGTSARDIALLRAAAHFAHAPLAGHYELSF